MILIFSDSHNNTVSISQTLAAVGGEASCFIHLGDVVSDTRIFKEKFPDTPLYSVAGNCDFFGARGVPAEIETEIGGKRFFITHGNKYGVKSSFGDIIEAAVSRSADICLFGHTHIPVIFRESGVLFLNPGSIHISRDIRCPTYGVININAGFEPHIVMIKDGTAKPLNRGEI